MSEEEKKSQPVPSEKVVDTRVDTTVPIWGILLILNFALSFRVDGAEIIPIFVISVVAGVLVTGFIWNWGRTSIQPKDLEKLFQQYQSDDNDIEKRKRDRLSQALSQLSDSQLTSLRDGIRNGTLDDERLRYMIDDEGELVERYD